MTYNILSLYKKTWPDNRFSVSFLHDSINCQHCLKGKIQIVPQIKTNLQNHSYEPPGIEDLSKSCFYQSHLNTFRRIEYNSIPESSFSPLGVKLTKSVAAKLNQSCDTRDALENQCRTRRIIVKSPSNCDNKKLLRKRKCRKTENQEPRIKNIKDLVKKQKIPVRKVISPSKLIKIVKEPTKGTLKRRRWTLKKLKDNNINYEDDLFEDQKFCSFQSIMEEESDNGDRYQEMRTPQISLSPVRDGSNTPTCEDCYSPGELFSNRKEAEEYIFRREKRRKLKLQDELEKAELSPEKPRHSEAYTRSILEKASKILQKVALKAEESDSDRDDYFSSVSEESD